MSAERVQSEPVVMIGIRHTNFVELVYQKYKTNFGIGIHTLTNCGVRNASFDTLSCQDYERTSL